MFRLAVTASAALTASAAGITNSWTNPAEYQGQTLSEHTAEDINPPLEMIDLEGGWFMRGDPEDVYVKTFVSPFSLSKYEITNEQYANFLTSAYQEGLVAVKYQYDFTTRSDGEPGRVAIATQGWFKDRVLYGGFDGDGSGEGMAPKANAGGIEFDGSVFKCKGTTDPEFEWCKFPVTYLHWPGARAFADYYDVVLPTEAEWEYAARGGAEYELPYPTNDGTCTIGNTNFNGRMNVKAETPETPGTPVDKIVGHMVAVDDPRYPEHVWGFKNLAGNALEWVNDFYNEDVTFADLPNVNPAGAIGDNTEDVYDDDFQKFVYRGGAYNYYKLKASNTQRAGGSAMVGTDHFGSRVAMRPANHPGIQDVTPASTTAATAKATTPTGAETTAEATTAEATSTASTTTTISAEFAVPESSTTSASTEEGMSSTFKSMAALASLGGVLAVGAVLRASQKKEASNSFEPAPII